MEGDKEAYVEETGKALKRQRKNINELNDEKAELARKLRVTKSRHNRNKDAENAAKIARLAEEQDTLGILIKREKQNMKVKLSKLSILLVFQKSVASIKQCYQTCPLLVKQKLFKNAKKVFMNFRIYKVKLTGLKDKLPNKED